MPGSTVIAMPTPPRPEHGPLSRAARLRKGALRWMVGSMLGGYTFGTAAPSAKLDGLIKKALEPQDAPKRNEE